MRSESFNGQICKSGSTQTNTGANTGATSFLFWSAVKSQTAAMSYSKTDKYKLTGNNSIDIKKRKNIVPINTCILFFCHEVIYQKN